MKRLSLLLATLTVVACNGDRLTGVAAQDAAIKYQNAATTATPIVVVDGKEVSLEQARFVFTLDVKAIHSVQVFKGNAARELYGDRGRNGVIVIETKAGR